MILRMQDNYRRFATVNNNNVVHILPYGELPSDVAVDGYYVSAYDYHNNESIIDYILNFYELTPAYYIVTVR